MSGTTFRQLLVRLAERIGYHQIPLRSDACEIAEFLEPGAVHHELVKRAVQAIYRANRCGHLDAAVGVTLTFEALGALRGDIIRSGRGDIDQLDLLEKIGAQVAEVFGTLDLKARSGPEPVVAATVIPLAPTGSEAPLRFPGD